VMERMAEGLPDAALLVIENAGHLVNSEAHRDCNKAIGAFLRRLRGSDINNQDQ